MLKNRFLRFLTTILMFVAVFVVMSILEIISANNNWNWAMPDGALVVVPVVAFAVCIVGQLFGDIMNVDKWLNNGLATLIKRVLFFAVVLGALLIGLGVTMSSADMADLLDNKASVFVIGVCLAGTYAPAIALLSYVILYIRDEDHKELMPFFFPISYVGSIVLGVILATIFRYTNLDYDMVTIIICLLDLAIVVGAIIACFRTATWPFEESGYYYTSSGYSGGYDDYSDSSSSSSSGSGSTSPEPKPTPCKRCAYASNTNPETGLFTGLDMVYCTVECKLKGYWDTREGTDCPYFRKG